jgi:hypothetical protein
MIREENNVIEEKEGREREKEREREREREREGGRGKVLKKCLLIVCSCFLSFLLFAKELKQSFRTNNNLSFHQCNEKGPLSGKDRLYFVQFCHFSQIQIQAILITSCMSITLNYFWGK